MLLQRPGLNQQDVAWLRFAPCRGKARSGRAAEMACNVAVAEAVAARRAGGKSGPLQGGGRQPDAVKPMGGIATVQPEPGADQREGGCGDAVSGSICTPTVRGHDVRG